MFILHPNMKQRARSGIRVSLRKVVLASAFLATSALAQEGAPLELRGMGSFHHGGRVAEIAGKPIRDISIGGGASQKTDPNGSFIVE